MTTATYRYPFPPYPTGWYLVAESDSLGPGEVQALRYFGRDLVLYRTESGEAVVADAHCPHMGAHLGHGGTVEGEGIRCPFHSWRFDATGAVDDIPYKRTEGLPKASLPCWPVHETSGMVLVHFSAGGKPPAWRVPDIPVWGKPGWVGYETVGWKVRVHVQEIAENIPDTTHFVSVHGLPAVPEAHVETDGHVYHQVMTGLALNGETAELLNHWVYGLGITWLEVTEPRYGFVIATTPIDDEHVELKLLFLVDEGPGATELSEAGRSAIKLVTRNTELDVEIWEHKVYRDRAPLVAGDGPIGVLRKWAKQFYETEPAA